MDTFGTKQSYEAYYVSFDFINVLTTADSIASAVVTAAEGAEDKTTIVTTAANQNLTRTRVNVWIKAGSSGHTYILTCKIVTTLHAELFEMDVELPVLDT